jgi:hypothetical protein
LPDDRLPLSRAIDRRIEDLIPVKRGVCSPRFP